MKLITLLLMTVACNTNALAQDLITITELNYYGDGLHPIEGDDFINELLQGGTDFSKAANQQKMQCQQQQYNGYEPEFVQTCEVTPILYRQEISLGEHGYFVKAKSSGVHFELRQKITQIIQQNQQQMQHAGTPNGKLYYQCKVYLSRYYTVRNPRFHAQTTSWLDQAEYTACLENGGDLDTCKKVASHEQQQQQQHHGQDQSHSQYYPQGSCKIVATR